MSETMLADAVAEIVVTDRRRPGRAAADGSLVQLLRHPAGDGECLSLLHEAHYGDQDELDDLGGDPGRGLAVGLLLSVPLWAVVIEGMCLVFQ